MLSIKTSIQEIWKLFFNLVPFLGLVTLVIKSFFFNNETELT